MGIVDHGDHHRFMGPGFSNVSHFKKWYKREFWYSRILVSYRDSQHGALW